MKRLLLILPILLLLGLAACAQPDDAEVDIDVEAPFGDAVDENLIGTWVLVSQGGVAPEGLVTVTFTTTGDYIILTEGRAGQHQHFSMAGENLIAVSDTPGEEVEQFEYSVGATSMTLTVPGTDATTELERRPDLLESRPDLVPPVPTDPDRGAVPTPRPENGEDPPTREEVGRELLESDEDWTEPEPAQ